MVKDTRVAAGTAAIPLLDVQHAMNVGERFRHVRVAGEDAAEGER